MLALVSIATSPGLPGLIGLLALSGMVVTDANALLSLVEGAAAAKAWMHAPP